MGILEAVLAVSQMSLGHSLGFELFGEPRLSLDMAGVAKVDLPDGSKILRGYGTFPHPNILGAFLVLSSGFTVWALKKLDHSSGTRVFLTIGLFLQFVGIFSTFSRSALLALLAGTVYLFLFRTSFHVPWKIFYTGGIALLLAFLTLGFLKPSALIARGLPTPNDQFIHERLFLLQQERHAFRAQWIYGVGMASYNFWLTTAVPSGTIEPWQYEYPHAVPLAVIGDLGLIGLFLVLLFLAQLFLAVQKQKRAEMILGMIVLLPFLFLDHYLWTVQPGRLLLWSSLGLCFSLLFLKQVAEEVP
jgi:O-antigen ligase